MSHGSLSIGLHIEDRSISVVALKKKRSNAVITHQAEVLLPAGLVVHGVIQDTTRVVSCIKELFTTAGLGSPRGADVVLTFPESQLFLTSVSTAVVSNQIEQITLLNQAVQRKVPLDPSILSYKSTRIRQTKEETVYTIAAGNYQIVTQWLEVCNSLKLNIQGFDIPAYAARRATVFTITKEPLLHVVFGEDGTLISYIGPQGIGYTEYCPIGVGGITEVLQKALPTPAVSKSKKKPTTTSKKVSKTTAASQVVASTTPDDASRTPMIDPAYQSSREMLITKGIQQGTPAASKVVLDQFMQLATYIDQVLQYVQSTYEVAVQMVVLSGTLTHSPGMYDFFKKEFSKQQVQLGDVHVLNKETDGRYVYATGAAWRTLHKKWDQEDPFVSLMRPEYTPESPIAIDVLTMPTELMQHRTDDTAHKTRMQLLVLLLILVTGGGLLAAAFAFRHVQPESKSALAARLAAQSVADIEVVDPSKDTVTDSSSTTSDSMSTIPVESGMSAVVIGDVSEQYSVWDVPSTTSTVVSEVSVGEVVSVIATEGEWYAIERTGTTTTVYIQARYLEMIE